MGQKAAMGRTDGSITVFLCLTLTCIMALIGGLYESARAAGCGFYMQMALDSALDSAAACYHRGLWDRYRVFGYWCGGPEALEEDLMPYITSYMDETPYYRLSGSRVETTDLLFLTDREGEFLEQEIVEYMKLGVFSGLPEPGEAEKAGNLLHQAGGFGKVLGTYKVNGRDVLRLEKAAEAIQENLDRQTGWMREADEALEDGDGGRFTSLTGKVKDECRKMPKLVEKYEKEADRLEKKLTESEKEAEEEAENMNSVQAEIAKSEISEYGSYIRKDGERRKQIVQAGTKSEENTETADRALERAERVQEIIDSWDEDEDDDHDEEDEIQLWRTVLSVTARYHRNTEVVSGKRDKKKMRTLEGLGDLTADAIFRLCIPKNMEVSGAASAGTGFPSAQEGVTGGFAFPGRGENPLLAVRDTVLFSEYGLRYFPQAVQGEKSAGLQYETEYLLAGHLSDRENLRDIVNRLVLVRTALNMVSIMQDAGKKAEAQAAAMAIAGTTVVLAPLVTVLYYMILTVWSMLEAIADVRELLSGGKIPLFKGPEDWRISPEGFLEYGTGVLDSESGGAGSGMSYRDWMRLQLLLTDRKTVRFRMMDMMQENLQEKDSTFLMAECAFRMEAEFSGKGVMIPLRRRAVKEY